MAVKVYVILAMLVFAGVVMPVAHAQLNLGGILGGLLNGLLSVTGVVPCSVGNSITSSGFPNAGVQLRCGGNVVGSSTTNSNGAFSIVGGVPLTLLGLLSSCSVDVTTPLVSCNVSLPSTGFLTAAVKPVGNLLGIVNLVPGVFSLVQN